MQHLKRIMVSTGGLSATLCFFTVHLLVRPVLLPSTIVTLIKATSNRYKTNNANIMRYLTFTSLLILLAFSILETSAQTQRNIIYHCAKGDISYTEPVQQKQSTSKAVGSILGSLLELSAGQT